MGRAPCCDKAKVKKGPWSPEEDAQLKDYIQEHGTGGNWIALPQKAGLRRCGKSCRLRWLNYLRPNIKHGDFSEEEDRIICTLFTNIGSRWSIIAAQLPGRTDNDIKNYWNTKLKKKMMTMVNSPQMSHHKITTYHHPHSMFLLNSPSPQSPMPSLPYTNVANYYNAPSPALSFSGIDHPNLMCYSGQNGQQEDYLSPNSIQSNYLVFGGAPEPSSTSSDGSSRQHEHHQQGVNFQEYSQFNIGPSMEDEDQKMGFQIRDSLIWDENALIMELISGNSSTTTTTTITSPSNYSDFNNCNGSFMDENKAGERHMLYC